MAHIRSGQSHGLDSFIQRDTVDVAACQGKLRGCDSLDCTQTVAFLPASSNPAGSRHQGMIYNAWNLNQTINWIASQTQIVFYARVTRVKVGKKTRADAYFSSLPDMRYRGELPDSPARQFRGTLDNNLEKEVETQDCYSPPMQAAKPAAAMLQATASTLQHQIEKERPENRPPTSAWQPPSAALIVLPRLNSIPIADAVSRNVMILFSGSSLMN